MVVMQLPQFTVRFGRFEFRSRSRVLLRDGVPCKVGSKAFNLLHMLLAHADRVVSKDEILGQLWPEQSVGENNIQVHICALRKLIGRSYLQNLPRQGYRFVAETTRVVNRSATTVGADVSPLVLCLDGHHVLAAGIPDGSDRKKLRWRPRAC